MRHKRLFFLILIAIIASKSAVSAGTFQEAIDEAAEYFVKQAVRIDPNEELHILGITDYYTRSKNVESEKIEAELYFAIEKLNPDFKLFLGEVNDRDKEIYLDGTFRKESGTTHLKLRVYKGTEILAQKEVTYDVKEIQKDLVAVLDIETDLLDADQRKLISDIFRSILSEKNMFNMVSTADIDKMDPEAIQEATACTRDECATIIGEQLGIDRVISTSLSQLDNETQFLTGKVIDVNSGALLSTRFVEHNGNLSNLRPALESLAEKLLMEGQDEEPVSDLTGSTADAPTERPLSVSLSYQNYNSEFFTRKNNPLAIVSFGYDTGRFYFGLELAASLEDITYQYQYSVPYSQAIDNRSYSFYMADLLAKVHFDLGFISPYIGGFIGMMSITEGDISSAFFDSTSQKVAIYPYGLVCGIRFFSRSRFNIQLEGRFLTVSTDQSRQKIEKILFGQPTLLEESYDITGTSVGLGVTYKF